MATPPVNHPTQNAVYKKRWSLIWSHSLACLRPINTYLRYLLEMTQQQLDSLVMPPPPPPPPVSRSSAAQPTKPSKNAVKRKLHMEAKAGPHAKAKEPRRTVSHCSNIIAVLIDRRLDSPCRTVNDKLYLSGYRDNAPPMLNRSAL